MKSNLKKAVRLLGQAVCISLITVVLAEVALRLYDYVHPLFIFYDDSYNRFRGQPHAEVWGFPLNAEGFNDLEFEPKKAGVYRIIGLGDSFAYGVVPYPQNYLTLLEEQLTRAGRATEVLNLGIPRTGPKEYLSVLVREGLALQPDLVLLSFFMGNDLLDSSALPPKRKLHEYSHVASLIHYAFSIRPQYEGREVHGGSYCDACPSMERETFLGVQERRGWQYLTARQPELMTLLDSASEALVRIQNLCRKKDIKLLVVLIPSEIQFDGDLQEEVKTRMGITAGWNYRQPGQMVTERLRQLGIDSVDLYDAFLEASARDTLYKPQDTHWNIAGNELAATHIARYVLDHADRYYENARR